MRIDEPRSTATRQTTTTETKPPPPPPPAQETEKPKKKGFFGKVKDGFDDARDKVGDLAGKTVDKGQQVLGAVQDKAEQVTDNVIDKAEELVAPWKDALDYEKQIDNLGKGDKYTLAAGGDASVEGIKGYAKGQIEVERDDEGKYVVTADAELGGGLFGQLGANAGANASVDGEALVGVGGKVEMKFDSPEEAKRATDALLRTSSPPLAAIMGGPPAKEDLALLKDHVSAIEVRGNGAASIAAEAGVGIQNAANLGVFASGEIKEEVTLRVEFEKDKKPSITIKQELSGQVDGGAQAGLGFSRGAPGSESEGDVGVALQGTVKGSVTTETKLSTDKLELDPVKLAQDPVAALAGSSFKATETTTTVTAQGETSVGKNAKGLEAKLVIKNSGAQVLDSGAIKHALKGDFGKALETTAEGVQVEASVTEFTTTGVSASPTLKVMGFGGTLEIESLREDRADSPMFSYQGNAKQAGSALASFASKQTGLIAMNQQVAAGRYTQSTRG